MKIVITDETRKRYRKRKDETEAEYAHRVAQYRASAKYQKKNIRHVKFGLNKKTEQHLIDFYDCIPDIYGIPKTSFFKQYMESEYEKYKEFIIELKESKKTDKGEIKE